MRLRVRHQLNAFAKYMLFTDQVLCSSFLKDRSVGEMGSFPESPLGL